MEKKTDERFELIEKRQERIDKQQKALYHALHEVLKFGVVSEWGSNIQLGTNGRHHELTELRKAFDVPKPEEEEPGEDQEWKTCDVCGGEGFVDVENSMLREKKCETCDGKGKYIDDMD